MAFPYPLSKSILSLSEESISFRSQIYHSLKLSGSRICVLILVCLQLLDCNFQESRNIIYICYYQAPPQLSCHVCIPLGFQSMGLIYSLLGMGCFSLKVNVNLWCDRVTCLGFFEILHAYLTQKGRFVCKVMGADVMLNISIVLQISTKQNNFFAVF